MESSTFTRPTVASPAGVDEATENPTAEVTADAPGVLGRAKAQMIEKLEAFTERSTGTDDALVSNGTMQDEDAPMAEKNGDHQAEQTAPARDADRGPANYLEHLEHHPDVPAMNWVVGPGAHREPEDESGTVSAKLPAELTNEDAFDDEIKSVLKALRG